MGNVWGLGESLRGASAVLRSLSRKKNRTAVRAVLSRCVSMKEEKVTYFFFFAAFFAGFLAAFLGAAFLAALAFFLATVRPPLKRTAASSPLAYPYAKPWERLTNPKQQNTLS